MFEDGVPLAVVSRGGRLCTVHVNLDLWSRVHFSLEIKEKKKNPAGRRAQMKICRETDS